MKKPSIHSGFTLVEVMLATVIALVVMAATLGTFRQVSRSRRIAHCYSELAAHGRYGLNLIRDDLANIFRSHNSENMRLNGFPRSADTDSSDILIMYVSAHPQAVSTPDQTLTDIYEVEYGLTDSPEGPVLTRRWAPVEDLQFGNAEGTLIYAARHVRTLTFEYYNGIEWDRSWNQAGVLPQAVRINIELAKESLNKEYSLIISQDISLGSLPRGITGDIGSTR